MDSGPPPLYHSVYSNFATWNHPKAPLDCSLQMAQPEDLLLMADVSTYYSGQGSPSHALLGMSASNAWNGGGSSLSVPFHQQPFDPNDMFTSNGTVLMATPHVSTSTTTSAIPYLNGTVSLVDSSTSQGRFYSQQPHSETIIFESGQAQPIIANNVSFADSVRKKYTSLPGLIEWPTVYLPTERFQVTPEARWMHPNGQHGDGYPEHSRLSRPMASITPIWDQFIWSSYFLLDPFTISVRQFLSNGEQSRFLAICIETLFCCCCTNVNLCKYPDRQDCPFWNGRFYLPYCL